MQATFDLCDIMSLSVNGRLPQNMSNPHEPVESDLFQNSPQFVKRFGYLIAAVAMLVERMPEISAC